ncbi:MAG: AmmeMemoRadiSam system protein B [Chlorobiaceae bacterium]|nr:AmmeMemoRadiSam system protein B [Chlorobiaceae bacterium]
MPTVRQPAVAGSFYPASREALVRDLGQLLSQAIEPDENSPCPKALIVPHAGYIYSGKTAAAGYASLRRCASTITRVILLGPVHRVTVQGLALPDAQAFMTPLGSIEIDQEAIKSLAGMAQVSVNGEAHLAEHSLEVQLPFLQTLLGPFKLVPLAVGTASNGQVAEVLERLWGGPETLIVISSDLSHFKPYEQASRIDRETVQRILTGVPLYTYEQACGATPINGMLLAAKMHGLTAHLVELCNSGDTAGNRQQVVGYAAFTFTESLKASNSSGDDDSKRGEILLSIARAAISKALGQPCSEADQSAEWLKEPGAVFVTLQKQGKLRGCVGSFEPFRPLLLDVQANAQASALRDSRFKPLTLAEWPDVQIELSLLGPKQQIVFTSQADALGQLQGGVDGIIFEFNQHRSTFLPQVWEQLPDPRQFMAHLKLKAGLPQDFWSDAIRLYRYHVRKWSEIKRTGGV